MRLGGRIHPAKQTLDFLFLNRYTAGGWFPDGDMKEDCAPTALDYRGRVVLDDLAELVVVSFEPQILVRIRRSLAMNICVVFSGLGIIDPLVHFVRHFQRHLHAFRLGICEDAAQGVDALRGLSVSLALPSGSGKTITAYPDAVRALNYAPFPALLLKSRKDGAAGCLLSSYDKKLAYAVKIVCADKLHSGGVWN